ncbi:AMP-binding protein [Vibrio pacinii]|uniref:AMP-binding protein n=1 Tax=Vibrio pacinii TaxID=170674 RepID=UPI00068E075D|nr:AMP-binding protein [Vibrio pacinii]
MKLNENKASKLEQFRCMDVVWLLNQWVERQPNKPFIVWSPFDDSPSQSWTYAELATAAKQVAAGLYKRGVGKGDFVLMHFDNSPDFFIAWFACAYLGATPVTTNTRSVTDNVKYFAETMNPVCAITSADYAAVVREACGDSTPVIISGEIAADVAAKLNTESFAHLAIDEPIPVLTSDPERNFAVQFTSGTTSRPKPTMWNNANALWAGKSMSTNLRLNNNDTTLLFLPLFHANAQISLLSTLWVGGTVVVQPKFSVSRFWGACVAHDITWVSMIPFAFKALKGKPVPSKHKVRVMMGLELMPELEKEFNVQIMAMWGMTETLSSCIVSDPFHPGPAGSIGRPSPFYDIEIRKEDDGRLAQPGEQGLLFVRGERGVTLFKEYYQQPEHTKEAFDDSGALDTGDIIRIDEQGWLHYVARYKDMLRVGGENVAALEIETAIDQTGLVMECAVVGQQHYMLGEVPVAFVSLSDKGIKLKHEQVRERIIAHCREKLADFKVPRSVMIVASFPRSTLDRISKKVLRERLPPIES